MLSINQAQSLQTKERRESMIDEGMLRSKTLQISRLGWDLVAPNGL